MAIFDQEHRLPEATEADAAFAVARAILGAVPVVGSAAQEILQQVIGSPLVKRQQEWAEEIAQTIRDLQAKNHLTLEQLRDDPEFIDAVLSATQAAIRTSQREKRQALLNAVKNSALPGAPELAVQQMFIATIDRFTEWHLRILKTFQDPERVARDVGYHPQMTSSLSALLEKAYPDLRNRRDFYDLMWSDLYAAGLVGTPSMHTTMSAYGAKQKRTTALGDAFLEFIADPGISAQSS